MTYYLHRISHGAELAHPLLERGILSVGGSDGNSSSAPGGWPPSLRRRWRAASRSASAPRVAKNSAVFMTDTFSATAMGRHCFAFSCRYPPQSFLGRQHHDPESAGSIAEVPLVECDQRIGIAVDRGFQHHFIGRIAELRTVPSSHRKAPSFNLQLLLRHFVHRIPMRCNEPRAGSGRLKPARGSAPAVWTRS